MLSPFVAIECGYPDPGQGLADRFLLLSWVLPERIDQHVGVEKIERSGNGPGREIRDQALLLVRFDTGSSCIIKSCKKLLPCMFKAFVSGCSIGHSPYEWAALIADSNQPVQGLVHQCDGIAYTRQPVLRS